MSIDYRLLETRPTVMVVDLAALSRNVQRVKALIGVTRLMASVKANAYGHGLSECGICFEKSGVDALGCAYLEEALILRNAGVKIPILVFGGLLADQVNAYIEHDIDVTASSIDKLNVIEAAAKSLKRRARIHLKIDTGMERLGVHYYSAQAFLERVLQLEWCDVVGIFSHFACSDHADKTLTKLQLERFLTCCDFFPKHSLPMPIRHIANSAATLELPETHLDMVRPGIGLYGVMPSPEVINQHSLETCMSLRTRVVYFKVVKEGSGVSYGHRWKAPEDTRVVTLPVGYGDGYTRALSNKAHVLIRGKRYPAVGSICMDQFMVNLGKGEAFNGDEVVLIGPQGTELIDVQELASLAGTIPYEILVGMNARIPREYRY
jgi:alanine racemase